MPLTRKGFGRRPVRSTGLAPLAVVLAIAGIAVAFAAVNAIFTMREFLGGRSSASAPGPGPRPAAPATAGFPAPGTTGDLAARVEEHRAALAGLEAAAREGAGDPVLRARERLARAEAALR